MHIFLGSLGFAGLLASAVAAGPFDGLYRPDTPEAEGWACKNVGIDGGALSVKDDVFEGVENQCKLMNPQEIKGLDAVLYDAECTSEGETYTMPMMLMRLPDGLAIIENGFVNLLKSCP